MRPEPRTVPTALLNSPGFLLGKAAQQALELVEAALAPLELKARHFGVLVALDEREPASQHQLAQTLRIDRTTMVAVVDHLERLGWVERRLHATDRRTHQVHRTPAGKVATDTARAVASRADAELVAGLSAAEVAQLLRLLRTLYTRAGAVTSHQ
jgi:DNA-binding MarR family transcriptional regulator